eukprot:scaffold9250_cov105-Isochrysis_galbana.AAC.14
MLLYKRTRRSFRSHLFQIAHRHQPLAELLAVAIEEPDGGGARVDANLDCLHHAPLSVVPDVAIVGVGPFAEQVLNLGVCDARQHPPLAVGG